MKKAKGLANISHAAYMLTPDSLTEQCKPSYPKKQRGAYEKVALKLYTKPSNKLVTGR
ncbi:hypothetical protein [Brucella sp. NBRC 12953]|uniref:hypothetical protein n=1 Tax=Brucella sp. NBRC 12953 TaxID=3075481 RepID=UPI003342E123